MENKRFHAERPDGRPDGRPATDGPANGWSPADGPDEINEIRYINKDNAVFSATEGGYISLDFDGKHYDRVLVFRSFPFSDAELFLSVRETVGRNAEIGIIKNINDLDDNARKLILHDLKLRYFVPKIKNIRSVRIDHGFATFIVVTDYGNMKFIVRSSGDAATRLSDKRIIFTDIDGNRYEIEDLDKLSAIETKRIDVFL